MDEKLVDQISSSSGIPQMLVSRSTQARAEASGVSVNDVLNSWTGGEAIQAAPANETVSESEVVVEDTPAPVEEQVDEPVEVEEPENSGIWDLSVKSFTYASDGHRVHPYAEMARPSAFYFKK